MPNIMEQKIINTIIDHIVVLVCLYNSTHVSLKDMLRTPIDDIKYGPKNINRIVTITSR